MKSNARIQALLSSYVVLGVLLFILIDTGFRIADNRFHLLNPLDSPSRSLIWWTVNGYANEKTAPDIALLGSSLMMTAHHAGDATLLKSTLNEVTHFHSSCIEDFLADKIGHKPTSFSFAIAGQMASDSYLIARSLLVGEKQPKVIVLGIAPRDLMDSTLPSAASTETFKYLSRVSDLSDMELSARMSLNEFIQYGFEKLIYSLSQRPGLVALQNKFVYSIAPYGKNAITKNELCLPFFLRLMARADFPEDNGANELMIGPHGAVYEPYIDNTNEYLLRYAKINDKIYKYQLSQLENLMKLAKDKGIQLVVVNMPLTQANVNLLPKGFYDQYKAKLAAMATANGASYVDMNKPGSFDIKHFHDSVHLNGLGGVEFFKLLSNELALDRSFGAALSATQ